MTSLRSPFGEKRYPVAKGVFLYNSIFLIVSTCGAESPKIWLDVPFVKQEKSGCGVACISMVIRYWAGHADGLDVESADAAKIQDELYSKEARGILASEVEKYFKKHGFSTFVFKGEWTDLERHLAKGRPLVVCVKEKKKKDSRHYIVITGLDHGQGVVFVNDPARRKLLKVDRASFEKRWKAANNWTLLAVP